MISVLPSVLVLGAAALAALALARTRTSPEGLAAERAVASRALLLALGFQAAHFAEERWTGFPERLGELLGLPAMPVAGFVAFNVAWLAVWAASVPGVRARRRWAFFAAWFLAVAGVANGVLHPVIAVVAGAYFPGLVSAPFVGAASIRLWVCLRRATASAGRSPSSRASA